MLCDFQGWVIKDYAATTLFAGTLLLETLSYHVRSLAILRPLSYEEAQQGQGCVGLQDPSPQSLSQT